MNKLLLLLAIFIISICLMYGASISGLQGVGLVSTNNITSDIVTNNYSSSITATSFIGDGSGLTGISGVITRSVQFSLAGQVLATATTNMLRDYGLTAYEWNMGNARLVNFKGYLIDTDTGAISPNVFLRVNGATVATLNMTRALSKLTWNTTTTFGSTSLVNGDDIEIGTDALGSNDDSYNLTIQFNAVTTVNMN